MWKRSSCCDCLLHVKVVRIVKPGQILRKDRVQLGALGVAQFGGAVVGFGVVGDGFTPSSLIFAGGAVVSLLTFIIYVT